MTVEEGANLFNAVPSIRDKLETLKRVGLGYVHIGQQATTLSGGEAQRVKLSKELSKRATGRTLYILDEPTTGLHFEDVKKLLEVLHELVDNGNSVLVIEHNLDVIKTADWILDLGPEGGDGGGKIVAEGTPEDIAKAKASYTGQYLAQALKRQAERSSANKPKLKAAAAEAPAPKTTRKNGKKSATG
jgi:excinuclease ABC subunit A